jgi:hypothetical protein
MAKRRSSESENRAGTLKRGLRAGIHTTITSIKAIPFFDGLTLTGPPHTWMRYSRNQTKF